jgi:hypothetical protein
MEMRQNGDTQLNYIKHDRTIPYYSHYTNGVFFVDSEACLRLQGFREEIIGPCAAGAGRARPCTDAGAGAGWATQRQSAASAAGTFPRPSRRRKRRRFTWHVESMLKNVEKHNIEPKVGHGIAFPSR